MEGLILISVVVVTHNSYSSKSGSIETCLLSLCNQKNIRFEIIVVDNLSANEQYNKLENFVENIRDYCDIRLVKNPINNISKGRNLGTMISRGEIIVYLDDDIILEDNDILWRVWEYSMENAYGYAASRIWTRPGWYENEKDIIDENLRYGEHCVISTANPCPDVRRKKNNRHLLKTYIGNFGYVKKDLLERVGMWDERYTGYGCEDDSMALKLYLKKGLPKIMNDIRVIHIWHTISSANYTQLDSNQLLYEEELKRLGIRCFHIGRIMYGEGSIIDYVEKDG